MSGLQETLASEGDSQNGNNPQTNGGTRLGVNFVEGVASGTNGNVDVASPDGGGRRNSVEDRFNVLGSHIGSLTGKVEDLTSTVIALADSMRANFTKVNERIGCLYVYISIFEKIFMSGYDTNLGVEQ